MNTLLSHPAIKRWDPRSHRLVRMGVPLSPALNPFAAEGVEIRPAFLYVDTFNSKAPVAYELVVDGIRSGKITPETTVGIASSGNTGLGAGMFCKALGLKCEIVMQSDAPASKINAVRALGNPVDVVLLNKGTVEYAREKGKQPGFYDSDQYGNMANLIAQSTYLAPQLWEANNDRIDVVVAPGGTLGTAGGLKKFASEHGKATKVILALCADGEEVPGARDRQRIERDVTIAKPEDFFYCGCAGRHDSFLASHAMLSEAEWTPGGPSSGLSLFVALCFIQKHLDEKTLDQLRGSDGRIRVVFLCPDDCRPYSDLYLSTLKFSELSSTTASERLYTAVRGTC